MRQVNRKLEHTRLEKYLTAQFHFRLNEITGSIEFKKQFENEWEELNEFNIYRQLKLEGFKINLNELIYLLKSDYVERFNPFLSYFKGLPAWESNHEDYIARLCSYVKLRNPGRFERHFKKWLVRTIKCALEDQYSNKNAIILVHEAAELRQDNLHPFFMPSGIKKLYDRKHIL